MKTSPIKQKSNLTWKFDAIHGDIDIRDATDSSETEIITKLLKSPVLERLRRIKQLGFASHSYPSADHSRYAHSLGTMHMMRMLFNRLIIVQGLNLKPLSDFTACFPDILNTQEIKDTQNILVQHMLVAALLQDTGELPFSPATKHIYQPSEALRDNVAKKAGFDISNLSNKKIFTIAGIYRPEIADIIKNLSTPFLIYLLTGGIKPSYISKNNNITDRLKQLRHMLDGVVDADRLDYVFRDAYHTIGCFGTSSAVVESLKRYDKDGPVFSDPGPVSNFLATRGHIYSTVYSTPANRFQVILLINFLQGVKANDNCAKEFFGAGKGELGLKAFYKLDDVSLTSRINNFASGTTREQLDEKADKALELFLNPSGEYQYFWLPCDEKQNQQIKKIKLPDDLYFDTFADHYRQLYPPDSVRIEAHSFKEYNMPISLEKCGGPFIPIFKAGWSILPMHKSILLFTPIENEQVGEAWTDFNKILKTGGLYKILMENDPLNPINFPPDTWDIEGFNGPKIFISFAWMDITIVQKIANILHKKRRQYYLYIKPFQGIGETPSVNSIEGVKKADVVLLLASSYYCMRYSEEPDGNIAKEIFAMNRRLIFDKNFKIVVLSADSCEEINKLPWSQLGFDKVPFTGKPLRDASNNDYEEAINETMKRIDD